MSSELAFYDWLMRVSIDNAHVIPFLFENRWYGQQDSIKQENWLVVRHCINFSRIADRVQSRFHTIHWIYFEDGQNFPHRKANMCLSGESLDGKNIFAKLWINLRDPQFNCGIALSPVLFGINGAPQIPNVPGLREMICLLRRTARPTWGHQEFLDLIINNGDDLGLMNDDPKKILEALCLLKIISITPDGNCCRAIERDQIENIFGNSLPGHSK